MTEDRSLERLNVTLKLPFLSERKVKTLNFQIVEDILSDTYFKYNSWMKMASQRFASRKKMIEQT